MKITRKFFTLIRESSAGEMTTVCANLLSWVSSFIIPALLVWLLLYFGGNPTPTIVFGTIITWLIQGTLCLSIEYLFFNWITFVLGAPITLIADGMIGIIDSQTNRVINKRVSRLLKKGLNPRFLEPFPEIENWQKMPVENLANILFQEVIRDQLGRDPVTFSDYKEKVEVIESEIFDDTIALLGRFVVNEITERGVAKKHFASGQVFAIVCRFNHVLGCFEVVESFAQQSSKLLTLDDVSEMWEKCRGLTFKHDPDFDPLKDRKQGCGILEIPPDESSEPSEKNKHSTESC